MRRFMTTLFLISTTLALGFGPVTALAQDVGPPIDAGVAAPVPADEGAKLAADLFAAVAAGNGWLAAGLGVSLLVWVLRNKLRRFLPVGLMNVLDQPLVAFSLPIVVSFFGGLGTAAMAGPLTWPIVGAVALGAIKTGAGAAFTFLLGANVRETLKPPAPLPSSTGEAVAAFNKGPQP